MYCTGPRFIAWNLECYRRLQRGADFASLIVLSVGIISDWTFKLNIFESLGLAQG